MPLSLLRSLVAAALLALAATSAPAQDGHGPDAWRVTGVAANDVLNGRMGPGTNYPVIERFAPNERGLRQITCVPYMNLGHYSAMSEAQRAALPPRWCLMQSADYARTAWVNASYLQEDTGGDAAAVSPAPASGAVVSAGGPTLAATDDPDVRAAMELVRDLYAAFESSHSMADNPFAGQASRYFSSYMTPDLAGHGADVLYNAQDFNGAVLRIMPDPDMPHIQGFITVHVDFMNFGQMNRATFGLRRDANQPGAPIRIIRVEHPGWSFPQ